MTTLTATYSPDDDKLRLYASTRLDQATYERVKGAGFKYAPKQGLFVAPMWTPGRADLLIELCGEIDDEDRSLVERAEERAERFETYSDKRTTDAERAHAAVETLANGIPLGQPILVGHHSERRARKDAERIQNGMRQAVKMWETADYWTQRATGALQHAKYKERPDVRARRIRTIESDQRKQERTKKDAHAALKLWGRLQEPESVKRKDGEPTTFAERALYVAGHTNTAPWGTYSELKDGKITAEQAQTNAIEAAQRQIAYAERWLAHCALRLTYERAMLAEQGGTAADRTAPEKGGGCRCWASPRGGWSYIVKVNKVTVTVLDNWGNGGRNFTRTIPFDKLAALMTAADVDAARAAGRLFEDSHGVGFILREPAPVNDVTPAAAALATSPAASATDKRAGTRAKVDGLREALREGVQVVSVAQLFPTPPALAARMVELAELAPGARVLEPSAGTGAIADMVRAKTAGGVLPTLVEIDLRLVSRLRVSHDDVRQADFLQCNGALGKFDAVLMNPPFENAADIAHIRHALGFLKPGGRLVAICANGPRQQAALRPLVDAHGGTWEELPDDTFRDAGTSVRTVLLTLTAP